MNQIRDALRDRLAAQTAVTSLLTAGANDIHFRIAPLDHKDPCVIFQKMSGVPARTFGKVAFDNEIWLVKAVSRNATKAEDVAAQLVVALENASLTLTGRTLALLQRVSDVDYGEHDGGHTYHHVGAQWRLVTTPA